MRRARRQPVLDVGAAQGFLGQILQPDGLIIDAVEPHPDWAARAEPYYRRVYASGIESAPLPPSCYQVVVCADVLEHTADPVSVLRQLRRAATPDALFIISLPNVAHIAARLLLLFGHFPKMERGIFDRTHLHFYTRRTAGDLLAAAGLRALEWQATPAPIGQIWRTSSANPLPRLLTRAQSLGLALRPTLFAYQWVIVATATEREQA